MAQQVIIPLVLLLTLLSSACKTTSPVAGVGLKAESTTFNAAEVIIGPELEFTFPRGDDGKASTAFKTARKNYIAQVIAMCSGDRAVRCTISEEGVTIESIADDVKIKVFPYVDPAVLEIPLDPMTLEQVEKAAPLINKYVFKATAAVGLVPGTDQTNRWSAHMNVSWPALRQGGDGELFMRFFTDYANHPELSTGILGGDIRNAPPLVVHNDKIQKNMADLVDQFNNAKADFSSSWTVAAKLRAKLYTDPYHYAGEDDKRYNAINLNNLAGDVVAETKYEYAVDSSKRMEIRAFYMPQNAEQLVSNYRIVTTRLAYLATKTDPLVYKPMNPGTIKWKPAGVDLGYSIDHLASVFIEYVTEMGLDPKTLSAQLTYPEVRDAALARLGDMQQEVNGASGKTAVSAPADAMEVDATADQVREDSRAVPMDVDGRVTRSGARY